MAKEVIRFDYTELRCRILRKFRSYAEFGFFIQTSRASISSKLLSGKPFNASEMLQWAKVLDIADEEFPNIFFVTKV